jgi:hypothetical protein
MTIIHYEHSQSLDPVSPQDYVTKHYTDTQAVTLAAFPPPYTGAGLGTYTDPLGDIWVAKAGVRSGNWYRPRDVLVCEYARAAAYTIGTALAVFQYDSVRYDTYGIYNASAGTITPVLPGWYHIEALILVNPPAAVGRYDIQLCDANGAAHYDGLFISTVSQYLQLSVAVSMPFVANDTWSIKCSAAAAIAAYVSYPFTRLSVGYLGTG